jgi:KaiC/GvpD/RAD55 family RecA-like ATPase
MYDPVSMWHSVVTGNPGIGKTSLSFLFILVLLELGVQVSFLLFVNLYVECHA